LAEKHRIWSSRASNYLVRVCQLKKVYDIYPVVDNIDFGLTQGECFALLGVTGAGKTSVFKCLTGEEQATRGRLHVLGLDLETYSGFKKARTLIGYCPQFDCLFDRMTVREHLEFYADLKGISYDQYQSHVLYQL